MGLETKLRYHFFMIAGIIIVADAIVKQVMLDLIFDPPRVIALLPILNLAPVWNEGVSFGLLAQWGIWTRHGITLLAVLVVIWLYRQLPSLSKWQQKSAALIAGGAIGNVIDRQIYGKVVDFVDFHLGTWHYPAFNIADAAIFCGVVIWVITSFRSPAQAGATDMSPKKEMKKETKKETKK